MKIQKFEVTVVGAPWRELTFVELFTDDGITGTGEVRMVGNTDTLLACIGELAPRYVVGSDPFDIERLGWNITRGEYSRPGEVTQSALAAFETACWDIMGQALGVPVWRLLGGAFRDRVPAYANGWYRTERDSAQIGEAARAVVARGYRALKLDPFGAAASELSRPELRRSLEIVGTVCEAVGPDVQIMIEMHGRFSSGAAGTIAHALEEYRPEWIEEPVPPENAGALQRVRSATWLPIAVGERIHHLPEFRPFLEQGCVDVLQADLTHFGGLLNLKRLAGWADAYYLVMAPHNVCGPIGTAANVHFAVATPNYKVLEHFNDFADPWVLDLVDRPATVDSADGCFARSELPGLGMKLNHDICREHPRTGAHFQLFVEGWERRADDPSPSRDLKTPPG